MSKQTWCALLMFCSTLGIRHSALAQAPSLISYQGRLLNGSNAVNGTVALSLRLFNVPTGGSLLYEDSNSVSVVDGLYSTFIGDHTTDGSLVAALTNPVVYVEVAVDGGALAPRERVASVGYALVTRGLAVSELNGVVVTPTQNIMTAGTADATIAGGYGNAILGADRAFVGGGFQNVIGPGSPEAVIAGGYGNRIASNSYGSAVLGGEINRLGPDSHHSVIGGGEFNTLQSNVLYAVLAGGLSNRIESDVVASFLGAGQANSVGEVCYYSFLGAGADNHIIDTSWSAVLAGGAGNEIVNAYYAFLGAGQSNAVQASQHSVLVGGRGNRLDTVDAAAIGGGAGNSVGFQANYASIPGGQSNAVGSLASHALAAGYRAKANHGGAFVWADRREADFASTGTNQFLIRAGGGVGINTNAPVQALHVNGDVQVGRPAVWAGSEDNRIINFGDANFVYIGEVGADDRMALRAGSFEFVNGNIGVGVTPTTNRIQVAGGAVCTGPAWVNASDRNLKDGFRPVDATSVLARVAALPIATWHYLSEGADLRHIGPTAQDFHAAFGVGYNDTTIATVDADGVALAAIQALAKQNAELRMSNAELKTRTDALEARLRALEQSP